MALGKEPYRHIFPADLTALRAVSPMAERVYIHLAFGERSSACCMASCEPEWLRYALRARRTSEVVDALRELEASGWAVIDWEAHQVWLPVQAKRSWNGSETSATGWRNDLERFKPSLAKLQAVAFIGSAPIAHSKGSKGATHHSNSNSNSNSSRNNNSAAYAAQPVADAKATPWTFMPIGKPEAATTSHTTSHTTNLTLESPKSEEEQRLPYNDKGNPEPEATTGQGDSPAFRESYEDEEVPDWAAAAMAKAAVPDALPSFPGVRNPEVAARLAAADAERQASLALTAPKAKPKRDLTPKQLDAIFAREQMAKWVAEWNGPSGMALVNAPAVMADVAKLATVLMGHAARLVSVDGALVGPHQLLGWAAQHGGYHGGQGPKKWTLKGWLAADHVGEVFAAYRDWCAKQERQKRWRYNIERTLTDWREECAEAAELAARFAEVSDAA